MEWLLIIMLPAFVIRELLKDYDGKGPRGRKGRRH